MSTEYLNPNIINRLDNLYLKAQTIVEGYMAGLHKSPYHGFSIEFSEHRAYETGDEVKNIDWKLWSKTDKYYIKRFEEETNMLCHIFLDSSKSMSFTSHSITKFHYAQMIASALSYLIIKQRDGLALSVFDSRIKLSIPPKNNSAHLNTILAMMDKIQIGNDTDISHILHEGAEKIKKKGLIILLSDLFDDPTNVVEALKHFKYYNHEVLVFHILDPQELNLDYNQKIEFEDLEENATIKTEPWQIKKIYKKEVQKFIEYFKRQCLMNKIDYNLLFTNQKLDTSISEYLNKRKKIL